MAKVFNLVKIPGNMKRIPRTGFEIHAVNLTEDGEFWIFDGRDWIFLGNVKGLPGDKGEIGDMGPAGLTPAIEVDNENHRVRFNIGEVDGVWLDLPRGARGDRGLTGDVGGIGPTGKPGIGERGPRGFTGNDGRDGSDGKPGQDGKDGGMPLHEWNEDKTRVRFEVAPGSWGGWSESLRGLDGKIGKTGKTGATGKAGGRGATGGASGASNFIDYIDVSSDYTVSKRHESGFLIDASSNAVTMTLPDASLVKKRVYWFKRKDSCQYAVKLTPNGSQTVDGETCIYVQSYENVRITSDGSNWYVI